MDDDIFATVSETCAIILWLLVAPVDTKKVPALDHLVL